MKCLFIYNEFIFLLISIIWLSYQKILSHNIGYLSMNQEIINEIEPHEIYFHYFETNYQIQFKDNLCYMVILQQIV